MPPNEKDPQLVKFVMWDCGVFLLVFSLVYVAYVAMHNIVYNQAMILSSLGRYYASLDACERHIS